MIAATALIVVSSPTTINLQMILFLLICTEMKIWYDQLYTVWMVSFVVFDYLLRIITELKCVKSSMRLTPVVQLAYSKYIR